jgi:mRNA interferase RelE/StbE
MTDILYSDTALEQLETLDSEASERLVSKLEEAAEWTEHRLSSLSNSSYYSVRAGDYRAIVDWDRDTDELRVLAAGHRRNVYRKGSESTTGSPDPWVNRVHWIGHRMSTVTLILRWPQYYNDDGDEHSGPRQDVEAPQRPQRSG